MKARRQLRMAVNKARKRHAGKNGVIPGVWFDFGSRGPWTDKREKKETVRRLVESDIFEGKP
jgi:hypothetical protein